MRLVARRRRGTRLSLLFIYIYLSIYLHLSISIYVAPSPPTTRVSPCVLVCSFGLTHET